MVEKYLTKAVMPGGAAEMVLGGASLILK